MAWLFWDDGSSWDASGEIWDQQFECISPFITGGIGPHSTIPLFITDGLCIGEAVATTARGGIGHRYRKRRIMVDGSVYHVRTRAEEREILDRYIAQQRQQVETAEPMHVPSIRAKIRRAERRREKVVAGEAAEAEALMAQLQQEDEEILILLIH